MSVLLNPKDWTDVASLIVVLTIPCGIVWGYVRFRLGHIFVSRAAHASLAQQVDEVDGRVRVVETNATVLATQEHLAVVRERVSALEVTMARLDGNVSGTRDAVGRVERMVELLVKNELDEGRARA